MKKWLGGILLIILVLIFASAFAQVTPYVNDRIDYDNQRIVRDTNLLNTIQGQMTDEQSDLLNAQNDLQAAQIELPIAQQDDANINTNQVNVQGP